MERQSIKHLGTVILFLYLFAHFITHTSCAIPTLQEWQQRCAHIPHFVDLPNLPAYFKEVRSLEGYCKNKNTHPQPEANIFKSYCKSIHAIQENELLHVLTEFIKTEECTHPQAYDPHVVGLHVEPESTIYLFGDRHGDVHSLLTMLAKLQKQGIMNKHNGFKIKDRNTYIVGIGDYINKGIASIETLLSVLFLKLTNPDNVILLRGNHEYTYRSVTHHYFLTELTCKFKNNIPVIIENIEKFFSLMPVAAFIGIQNTTNTTYLCATHAAPEIGYNPKHLFDILNDTPPETKAYENITHKIDRQNNNPKTRFHIKEQNLMSPKNSLNMGFLQDLILAENPDGSYYYNPKTHLVIWNKKLINYILKDWSYTNSTTNNHFCVKWIIRGHQHTHNTQFNLFPSLMQKLFIHNGVDPTWAGESGLFTLQVAPDNEYSIPEAVARQQTHTPDMYPGFNYDTWAKITLQKDPKLWTIEKIHTTIFPQKEHPIIIGTEQITTQMPFN